MKLVGIDPGNKGGIAICEDGKIVEAISMPIQTIVKVKKESTFVHAGIVYKMLKKHDIQAGYIEFVSAMKGQGVTSVWTFGFGAGNLHAIFDILEIPLYYVTPQRWKKEVLGEITADKDDAINFCLQNCPDISLKASKRCKTNSDGIADAICIAIYGMKQEIIRNKNINKNNQKEDSNDTEES